MFLNELYKIKQGEAKRKSHKQTNKQTKNPPNPKVEML